MDEVTAIVSEAVAVAAWELGMDEGSLILLTASGGGASLVLYTAYAADGVRGVLKVTVVWPAKLVWLVLKPVGVYSARCVWDSVRALAGRPPTPQVDNPANAELAQRKVARPARMPGLGELRHGLHSTVGGVLEAPHKVIIGQTGSAKNQADLNYELQHQLEHSNEHIVVTDVKTNAEISRIVYAYARPEDRIFVYSFHPGDRHSSALRLFRDPDEAADLAFMLTDEANTKDSHWNEKAAELIEAVAVALTRINAQEEAERAAEAVAGGDEDGRNDEERNGHEWNGDKRYRHEPSEIAATLNQVRDVIADKRKLEEIIKISPVVANVADVEKEWGLIRSTASRRLTVLSSPAVRRVFAGRPGIIQPNFSRRDGRDIVIVRPYAKSARRLSRYIYAVLDVIFRAACDGGDAGGPGTKFIIDEAASYMKLQNLPEYLDLGRASKVQVTYAIQGTRQVAVRLGRDEADHLLSSTEIKVIGATTDLGTARMISELSRPEWVYYRGPRQRDELVGQMDGKERPLITPYEITGQRTGEFVVQQGPDVWKVRVDEEDFHHAQAAPTSEHPLWGYVDPSTYELPALLDSPPEDGHTNECEDENGGALDEKHRHDGDVSDEGSPKEEDDDDLFG